MTTLKPEQMAALSARVSENIRTKAVPALKAFVEIPNTSRLFDPEWATNGLQRKACQLCVDYATSLNLAGLTLAIHEDEGTTPFLFGIIPAFGQDPTKAKTVVSYGHIDKQPPLTEKWQDGLLPTVPEERNGLLYGRGAADNGYNWFSVLTVIKSIQEEGLPHDRVVLFFETDEESDSKDIPHYLAKFRDQIGDPELMLCLDAACMSDTVFSIATSMRGILNFDLRVKVLDKGVHSGHSGVAPSTFRVARVLLDRLEDSVTGKIKLPELNAIVPEDKMLQVKRAAEVHGPSFFDTTPIAAGVQPTDKDVVEAYLNKSWRPQLEIIGQAGIPPTTNCGNVLRDETVLRCSIRLPPTVNDRVAFEAVKKALEHDPPYSAQVSVDWSDGGNGFCARAIPPQVMSSFDKVTQQVFDHPVVFTGNGGSIPFVSYLQSQLPKTLLLVSGASLPDSCSHGPNENLNLPFLQKYMSALAGMLTEFAVLPYVASD